MATRLPFGSMTDLMSLTSGQGVVMAPSVAQPPAGAISPDQLQAIAAARLRSRKIDRAAGAAAFSGWTLGIFSAVTLLFGLFDLTSLLLGIGLAVSAHVELRGSKALKKFDLTAPKRLAINQIVLGVMLVAYGAWGIISSLTMRGPYDSYLAAGGQLADAIRPIARIDAMITIGFYAAVICLSAMAQGCAAWYYATRKRHIRAYLDATEPWIIEALRAAA